MTWDGRVKFYVWDGVSTWVDLSSRVLDNVRAIEVFAGQQVAVGRTLVDSGNPVGRIQLLLRNADDWLTYGNTSSPWVSWFVPGALCRLTEQVNSVTNEVFRGFLLPPQEVLTTASADQVVSVAAVDRMGWLQQGDPFISTLAAHIMGSARNGALKGYWPLNDEAAPLADVVGSGTAVVRLSPTTVQAFDQLPSTTFAAGPTLPGDDLSTIVTIPGLAAGSQVWPPNVDAFTASPIAIAAGNVATAVVWVNRDISAATLPGSDEPLALGITTNAIATNTEILFMSDSIGTHFRQIYYDGSLWNVDSVDGCAQGIARWYALAIRWGFSPNVLELWVDGNRYTGTFPTAVSSASTNGVSLSITGAAAHLQLYVGAPTDFAFADFAAQRQVGLTGLDRQMTGDRVRSILTYAGVPSTEWNSTVDAGTSVMQPARLAGLDPLSALRQAEITEQGLLYVDGSGNTHFADRRTLYGI